MELTKKWKSKNEMSILKFNVKWHTIFGQKNADFSLSLSLSLSLYPRSLSLYIHICISISLSVPLSPSLPFYVFFSICVCVCVPFSVSHIYMWAGRKIHRLKNSYENVRSTLDDFFWPIGSKHCNTNERNMWTARWIISKSKPNLIDPFNVNIFQLVLVSVSLSLSLYIYIYIYIY